MLAVCDIFGTLKDFLQKLLSVTAGSFSVLHNPVGSGWVKPVGDVRAVLVGCSAVTGGH